MTNYYRFVLLFITAVSVKIIIILSPTNLVSHAHETKSMNIINKLILYILSVFFLFTF